MVKSFPSSSSDNLPDKLNDINTSLAQMTTYAKARAINIKSPFGTNLTPPVGDGITDDTAAIQAIINYAVANNLNVYVPKGNYKITNLNLVGVNYFSMFGDTGSCFKNGSLTIGDITLNGTNTSSWIHIEGIEFLYDNSPDQSGTYDNQKGIILANASFITITRCYFEFCSEAIYIYPLWQTQHVKRLRVQECILKEVDYAFYVDNPTAMNGSTPKTKSFSGGDANPSGATGLFFLGDSHFINNQVTALYDGVHGSGFDGFVCIGNTFFTPGAGSTTRRHNINIDYSNWVIIQGNNLFEAGQDAIHMNRFQHLNAQGNNIAWCQNDGIKLSGGDYSGNPTNWSIVDGNAIAQPGNIGIEIIDNCGIINVRDNLIHQATALGMRALSSTVNIRFSGNQTPDNTNDIQNSSGNQGDNIQDKTIVTGKLTAQPFTTTYGNVVNIVFPRAFKSGTTPTVLLTITELSTGAQVTAVARYISNTAFYIAGIASVAVNVDIEWVAIGER